MTQHGEISWDSNYGTRPRANAKDLFLRLDDGDNKLRLITLPHQYSVHRVKIKEDDKYGQKINCSQDSGSCPLCDEGHKAKHRWLIGVLSRKDGKTKILDMSYMVFDQIRKLAKSEDWGDPTLYDVNVVVDRQGGATGYYSVHPSPKKPLTADEQVLKDTFDLDEMRRRVSPPTAEMVSNRLSKLREMAGVVNNNPAADTSNDSDDSDDSSDSDDDSDFPDFEAASV